MCRNVRTRREGRERGVDQDCKVASRGDMVDILLMLELEERMWKVCSNAEGRERKKWVFK